ITDQPFAKRRHQGALGKSGSFRTGLLDPQQNRIQFRPRLLGRNAGLESPNTIPEEAYSLVRQLLLDVERARQQHISLAHELKPRRHYADHLPASSVERQRLTDDGRVAAEAPLPESVAQDYHRRDAGPILFRRERPPQLRRDA